MNWKKVGKFLKWVVIVIIAFLFLEHLDKHALGGEAFLVGVFVGAMALYIWKQDEINSKSKRH